MKLFKQIALDFGKSVTAGVVISFGATVFLMQENRIFSSLLFSLGLFVVCNFELNLYTGRVGYLVDHRSGHYARVVGISWIGNLIGIWLSALVLQQTRLSVDLKERAQAFVDLKSGDSLLSMFILGIYCGILMYIAVAAFRLGKGNTVNLTGYLGIFLCVAVFIHCGFEHSIADMFYYCVTNSMGIGRSWLVLLLVSLGNAVGSIIFRAAHHYLIERPKGISLT